jgi:hypothetical protein
MKAGKKSKNKATFNPNEKQIVIGPASKKQEMFLNSDATITLAGGAAKQKLVAINPSNSGKP